MYLRLCDIFYSPVAALIDIPILRVDKKEKERVQAHVVQEQGPTDSTVVISTTDATMIEDDGALIELFSTVGEILIVRCGFIPVEILVCVCDQCLT